MPRRELSAGTHRVWSASAGGAEGVTRRQFLRSIAASTAVAGLAGACGGTGPTQLVPRAATGSIRGTVTDLQGNPLGIGQIFLLRENGFNTGVAVDVDPRGRFAFEGVPAGAHQLRFHAPYLAHVPAPHPNPLGVTVAAGREAAVAFRVQPGAYNGVPVEIYAGDFFFQKQPYGRENERVEVLLGTTVCWYNVGKAPHVISGGPWGESGVLNKADQFEWVADTVGTFGYVCRFHSTEMRALLTVVD